MKKNVQIGLVQTTCTNNQEENLQKAIVKVREAAAKGAQIICLQELFTSLYFCDEENYDNFSLAEAIPVHQQMLYKKLQVNWEWSLLLLFLRNVLKVYIITQPLF